MRRASRSRVSRRAEADRPPLLHQRCGAGIRGEKVMFFTKKASLPTAADALPGRAEKMPVPELHAVNGARIVPPFPAGLEQATFGMGCFWGAERKFWQLPGVYSTAVGYA